MRRAGLRRGSIVVLASALLAGTVITPAVATPAAEATYLTAIKQEWKTSTSAADQKTTCDGYRAAPASLITMSVNGLLKDPDTRKALSRAAWRRVITKYLAWACSGPNHTPR